MADLEAEILATGTYKGITVTPTMLDHMVENFGKLRSYIKPAGKLGHDWSDSEPACGLVTNLKRVGEKLVAELSSVPPLVRRGIAAKLYNRVSAEFHTRFEHSADEKNLKTGVTGPVLTGLAFLGARPPAVKNLADLEAFFADQSQPDAGAVLALSDDAPTIVDEAQAKGAGGSGDAPVASSPPQIDVKQLAAMLHEAMRQHEPHSHASGTPRLVPIVPDPNKEPMMIDADTKKALLSELRAELAEERETERKQHDDELKAVKADVTALSEAKAATEAELKTAKDEMAAIRSREVAAQGIARRAQAEKFAEDNLRAPRLFKGQVPFATALYEMLSDEPVIKKDGAVALGLPEQDWSLRGLFAECVAKYPTANILRELATAPTQPVNDEPGDALAQIALEHKLNLSEPHGLAQATALLKQKGIAIPDYSTPTKARAH